MLKCGCKIFKKQGGGISSLSYDIHGSLITFFFEFTKIHVMILYWPYQHLPLCIAFKHFLFISNTTS